MLTLERLEDRVMPDAFLAAIFQTQVIPQLEAQNAAAIATAIAVAQKILPLATAQQAAVNTPATAAALANLAQETTALIQAAAAEESTFPAALESDELALLSLPTQSNELAQVNMMLAQLAQLGPALQAAEVSWQASI